MMELYIQFGLKNHKNFSSPCITFIPIWRDRIVGKDFSFFASLFLRASHVNQFLSLLVSGH